MSCAHTCHCCHACDTAHGQEEAEKSPVLRLALAGALLVCGLLFPPLAWLKLTLYLAAYLLCGAEILFTAVKNLFHGEFFDENFLMAVASLGAFCIGEYPEAVAVMLFYQIGETLQERAAGNSRKSIVKLMDLRPDFARVVREGKEEKIAPQEVKVGELTLVLPGERVPLDGVVESGSGQLDASALTGESRPVSVCQQDTVLAGCINGDGVLKIRVQKTYENSTVAKILELTQNAANKKSSAEKFITRFARIYTPAVVCAAVLVAVLPPLVLADAPFKTWFYRALIFLVISCPCALVLSVPLGFFGGIGGAAKNGILIKGGSYMELLSRLGTLAFDKTGTLTQGVFGVTALVPAPGVAEQTLLDLAARAERYSNHPIAKAILKGAHATAAPAPAGQERVHEYAGEGVELTAGKQVLLAGNKRLMARFGVTHVQEGAGTCVYVAENGLFKGRVEVGDTLKEGAKTAVAELKNLGMHLVILSGDSPSAVEKTAQEAGISQAYGGLLPAGKVEKLEEVLQAAPKGTATAFAGDGINDAPVLARADLGIAMGALGSDAAIEAADVVLMTDEPQKIAAAVRLSRRTLAVVKQNIVFALAVKAGVMALGVLGLANMWGAVFADVGVSLLAVANSLRPLYFKE